MKTIVYKDYMITKVPKWDLFNRFWDKNYRVREYWQRRCLDSRDNIFETLEESKTFIDLKSPLLASEYKRDSEFDKEYMNKEIYDTITE